jgi:hypothetical protein
MIGTYARARKSEKERERLENPRRMSIPFKKDGQTHKFGLFKENTRKIEFFLISRSFLR